MSAIRYTAVVVLLCCIQPIRGSSIDTESIRFGTVEIRLSMDESALLQQLTAAKLSVKAMDVTRLPGKPDAAWIINDTGVVWVRQHRVIGVQKFHKSDSAEEIAASLFFIFRQIEETGNSSCLVETDHSEGPEYESQRAMLRCGHKKIDIQIQKLKSKDGEWRSGAMLTEELD